MTKKILVAVDISERDRSVLNTAVSLAKSMEASLMLLHILTEDEAGYPILPTYAYYPLINDRNYELYQQKLEEYKQWGIDFLQNLTEEAIAAGVKTEYTQLTGNPGRTICEIADNWSADLILVGSRGLKGLKEIFLGSVSNYVTHYAPCSVLIVRRTKEERDNLDAAGATERQNVY
ncbi:universal stress protein [Myxosarcina sp. GI1]|uniref:universal stress protein n=1 Tax=Myxosarcina sp. GI1 TaxID=1541065 RepID=UPI0005653FFF|nr:universal stress protein [Myxosarcina sp. GI1]